MIGRHTMTRTILVRLAWTLAILLGVSFIAFMLMRALPGDFAHGGGGHQQRRRPKHSTTIRRDLGLDRPLLEQYLLWLGHALTGDFGTSFVTQAAGAGRTADRASS